MPDEGTVVREKFDGDDIESAGRVVQKILVFGQITLGDSPDLSALRLVDGFFRKAEGWVGSGFDFDEDQRCPLIGDNVDFPSEKAITAFDDLESFSCEIADGRLFASAA
jgi:hypothetical protein